MAATHSTMLALGTPAPHFSLRNVAGGTVTSLEDFSGRDALLVIFLCAHCPYVHHVAPELARLGSDYAGKNVGILAITSNDVANYPQDAPEPTARFAREQGWSFPVLHDETQEVARQYTAACTPDFFLFGRDRLLVYRGQLDSSRPGAGASDGRDLRKAIEAVLTGSALPADQKPSIGCNIKWRPGNEPAYFG